MRSIACSFILALFVLVSCKQSENTQPDSPVVGIPFIQPPLPEADVPFTRFFVTAEKGDTLFAPSGGIILFPRHAFVDKAGKVINGDVEVNYREFSEPIDFYLAGIPMNYDSAGKQYQFESSGMCELLAFQNGAPVYVNPASKPEIILPATSTSTMSNLYFLDTLQRKWINKGTQITTDLNIANKKSSAGAETNSIINNEELIKPLKPEKAPEGSTVIRIVIDPASFSELLVYDNLKFQIDPENNNFLPKDADEEWSDVKLQKGKKDGLYNVTFTNKNRTVTYAAKPVLDGADYDKAMKLFEEKNKEYELLKQERLAREADAIAKSRQLSAEDSMENVLIAAEMEKIDELNKLIDKRNAVVAAQNIEIEKENRERRRKKDELVTKLKELEAVGKKQYEERIEQMKKQQSDLELQIKEQSDRLMLMEMDESVLQKVVQRFAIDGFGIWNCDRFLSNNPITLMAEFKIGDGTVIELRYVAVVQKAVNGILSCYNKRITVAPDSDHMIFGVYQGRFAYLSYTDYKTLNISRATKQQVFTMRTVSREQNNCAFIKQLIRQQ